jgi:hypothetical protein
VPGGGGGPRVDLEARPLVIAPETGGPSLLAAAQGRRGHLRHQPPPRCPEAHAALRVPLHPEPALVHRPVVHAAEQQQVVELRRAAVRPVLHVVRVAVAALTAGEATCVAVPLLERPADRRRHGPAPPPDVEHVALRVVCHLDQRGVAREPPRRFRGNALPARRQHRLARSRRSSSVRRLPLERRALRVQHDLQAVGPPGRGGRRRRERLLGHEPERVRTPLAGRRPRLRPLPVQLPPRPLERLLEQRAHLRIQPTPQHPAPVLVRIQLHVPTLVARPLLLGLLEPIDPPPSPHHSLDVRRRCAPRELEQLGLVIRRHHPRERAHLRVR